MVYYQTYLHNIDLVDRVCGLWLGPNFGVQLTAEKNFYLWITVERMHPFAVIIKKYLRSYGCSGTNLNATLNCRN